MKTVLITGASQGLGLALVETLVNKGFKVIATARDVKKLAGVNAFQKLQIDVGNQESIILAIQQIETVDIVINNAAISLSGAIEKIPMDAAQELMNINVLGSMRMMQLFIPLLREKGAGLFVNISSGTAMGSPPMQGLYAASKAALDRITESFRMEVRPFGVDVMLIHATGIDTKMRAAQTMYSGANYSTLENRVKHIENRMKGVAPSILAKTIVKIMEEQPQTDFVSTLDLTTLINQVKKETL